mgnify:CR=1 FL=1
MRLTLPALVLGLLVAQGAMAAGDGTNVETFRESLVKEVKKQHLKIYPHYLEDEVVDMSKFEGE